MNQRTAEPEVMTREPSLIDTSAARPLAKVSPQAVAEHSGGTSLLEAIARAASNPAIDMDKVERLYKMHQAEQDRQAQADFNAAMARAQSKIVPVVKNAYNNQTNSWYAKLDAINDAVMPIITAEGLSISFNSSDGAAEGMIRTVAIVAHSSGFSRQYFYDLPLDDSGIKGNVNKTGLHARGSTSAYARRYLVCLIFNVATEDDKDGNRPQVGSAQAERDDTDPEITKVLEACGSLGALKTAWGKLTTPQREAHNKVFASCKKNIEAADRAAAQK